ncbi:MAG: AraC family transcriptional regulator [Marinovum sp.]|nr:AraC family transcriptional regulator [Marinovum sp.]
MAFFADGSSRAPHHVADPILELKTLARLSAQGPWRVALPHARDSHLLIWITRGQGRATIQGVRRGIGAHNVLWLPAGTQFCLDFGPQVFGQTITYRQSDPSLLPLSAQHLRIRDVSFQGEFNGLIELITRETQTYRPFQDEALLAKFILIEVWLRRMMLQVGSAEDRVHLAVPERLTAARRLAEGFARRAEEEFRSGRTMADYASDLNVTPTHLTRVCREVTGMTAADLLTGRVLHEAQRLLCDSDAPAQNIARHLGFGSAAYFSRFIQKHTGQPPSALRRAA